MSNSQRSGNSTRMARTVTVVALGAAVTGGLASCGVVLGTETGSGVAESIIYDFETVDEVQFGNAFNASVTIQEGPVSVEIIIDDNLSQYLEVDAKNGALDVDMESGSYEFRVGPELIITTPDLKKLDASGASSANVTGLDAEAFELEASGASNVEIEGDADKLTVDLSGASSVTIDGASDTVVLDLSGASSAELTGLMADTVDVDMSGASDAELGDVTDVTGELSGASSLEIDSDTNASVETSGASSVDRR